ncbi:MAG: SpoIIE family protein phosphatase [Pseudomonadota bacterium]
MSEPYVTLPSVEKEAEAAGPLRILVVDDSRLQRSILQKSLGRWGFDVVEAASGEKALEECARQMPDLIVSDWMMPGMSGLEFCKAFREISKESFAYFILVTSKSEKAEVARGLDSGADDFLTKPVNADELRARISSGTRIVKMQRELTEKNRLISVTLEKLQVFHEVLDKDLREAKRMQQSLIRETHKVFDEGKLSLLLRSSGHVGGDLVGFFPAGDHRIGLYSIDVSGHGVSSALMTARLAGYLSAAAPSQNVALAKQPDGSYLPREPDLVVEALNDLVLNEMKTEHYFTLLLVILDPLTGHATLSQAGHPHPLIQRADGTVEQDGTGGFPVGLMEGVSFNKFDVQLYPGDRLLLLSDGVTECPDAEGEMLGEAGLERIVNKLRNVEENVFLEALVWELSRFAGTETFPDDVSGVLWEFRPDAALDIPA